MQSIVLTDKEFKEAQKIAQQKAEAETMRRINNKEMDAKKSSEHWHKWQEAND